MQQTPKPSRRVWKRRALSLLLALVMVLGLVPVFPVTEAAAHWADTYLSQLVEWGFIRADQANNPDRALTRADFMAIVNRAYGYHEEGETPFEDIKETDWFYDDVGIAYTARYIKGTSPTTASPNNPLTRETAATILGRNMMLQESPGELVDFTDAHQISTWASGVIKSSLEHYLIGGYNDGTFRPKRNVSWGEMASMLTNLVGTPLQEPGDYSLGGVYGNVTITSPDVTLRDTVISGDLYISGGVGLGGIELENVTVLGRIVACGTGQAEGGQASILLRNVTADELLVDNLQDHYVSLRADGITEIGRTTVRTSAYIEDNTPDGLGLHYISLEGESYPEGEEPEDWVPIQLDLAGRIEEVVNRTPRSQVRVGAGTVAKLTVDETAEGSNVIIDRGAVVKELNLDTATPVTGQGDIEHLAVNAPGCEVEMLPDQIDIRPGITAIIAGEEMDTVGAKESSEQPMILAGYPQAQDVVPTGLDAAFMTNKAGTVYWAVSAITDGSVGEEDLIKPPSYGNIAVRNGSVKVLRGNEETISKVTGLTPGGSYYLSAILVDARGQRSTVKVISFTTPDNTVPAFCAGYPRMSTIGTGQKIGEDGKPVYSQVVVMPNKDCKLYYALMPQGATAPTENELKANAVSGALGYGVRDVKKNTESIFAVHERPLNEQTTYVLYLWLTDADGINKGKIVSLTFTTDDETPPKFIRNPYAEKTSANRVTMKYQIDEPATVYWVAFPVGSVKQFPMPRPGSTTVDLKDLYSIQQVVNGMNIGADGLYGQSKVDKANADGAFIGNFTISGMKPETSYEVWYVAKDKAGADRNYSAEGIQKVIVSPEDNNPPIITQSFSRTVDASDKTKNPRSNTDIYLDFSEDVYPADNRQQSLQQMGVNAAKGDVDAKNLLAAALYDAIKMYQLDGEDEGVEVDSITHTQRGDGAEFKARPDAVIDYTQAKVSFVNGSKAIRVEFPSSALHLSNGEQYYFAIKGLVDSTGNYLRPDDDFGVNFRYNRDNSIYEKHQVDIFTVEFGGITFSEPTLNSMPVDVSKTDGSVVPMTKSVQFRLKPDSTSTVDDLYAYDLVIWNDKKDLDSIGYDLYYRVVRVDGKSETPLHYLDTDGEYKYYEDANYNKTGDPGETIPSITDYLINKPNGQTKTGPGPAGATVSRAALTASPGDTETGETETGNTGTVTDLRSKVGTVDKDGWIYLGRTERNVTPSEGDRRGRSLNMSFNGCTNYNDLPKLNTLNENLRYDFVIAVTYYNGSSDASTWDGWARFYINLAAGQAPNLLNIGQSPDHNVTWKGLIDRGLRGGVQSVGYWPEAKAGEDSYEMMRERLLSPSGLPSFVAPSPEFIPTADGVTIKAGLTNTNTQGRIYYAISEKQADGTPALTTYRAVMNTDLDENGVIQGIEFTEGKYEGRFLGDPQLDTQNRLMFVSKGGSQEPKTGGITPARPLLPWMKGGGPTASSVADVVAGENLLIEPDRGLIASESFTQTEVVAAGHFEPSKGTVDEYRVPQSLKPDTDYFVYLVIGMGNDRENVSHVYMYQFKTLKTSKPKTDIQTPGDDPKAVSGDVTMGVDVASKVSWCVYTESDAQNIITILSKPFSLFTAYPGEDENGDPLSLIDSKTGEVDVEAYKAAPGKNKTPDLYLKNDDGTLFTVYDALRTPYGKTLASSGYTSEEEATFYFPPDDADESYEEGYTVFDIYANNNARQHVYNLIQSGQPGRPESADGATRGPSKKEFSMTDPKDGNAYSYQLNQLSKEIFMKNRSSSRFVFLMLAVNPKMQVQDANGKLPDNYTLASFRAAPFQKDSLAPPKFDRADGGISKDRFGNGYSGEVSIYFELDTFLAAKMGSSQRMTDVNLLNGIYPVSQPTTGGEMKPKPESVSERRFTLNINSVVPGTGGYIEFNAGYFANLSNVPFDSAIRIKVDTCTATGEVHNHESGAVCLTVELDGVAVFCKAAGISVSPYEVVFETGFDGTRNNRHLLLDTTVKKAATVTANVYLDDLKDVEYRWTPNTGIVTCDKTGWDDSDSGKTSITRTITAVRPGKGVVTVYARGTDPSGGDQNPSESFPVKVTGAIDPFTPASFSDTNSDVTVNGANLIMAAGTGHAPTATLTVTAAGQAIDSSAEVSWTTAPAQTSAVVITPVGNNKLRITPGPRVTTETTVTVTVGLRAKDNADGLGTDLTPKDDDKQTFSITVTPATTSASTSTPLKVQSVKPALTLSGSKLKANSSNYKLELTAKSPTEVVTATTTGVSGTVAWNVTAGKDTVVKLTGSGSRVTITALAAGTATIEATIGSLKKTIAVTVVPTITLSEPTVNTDIKKTADGTYTWSRKSTGARTVKLTFTSDIPLLSTPTVVSTAPNSLALYNTVTLGSGGKSGSFQLDFKAATASSAKITFTAGGVTKTLTFNLAITGNDSGITIAGTSTR